jgi:long-subunit acyl-CoA synthetase (AMP-forming)
VAFDLVYIADKCADLDLDLDLEDGSVGGRTRAFPDFLCSHHGAESPLDIDNFWGESKTTDVCCLQFTSGTTGARKASMLSHR